MENTAQKRTINTLYAFLVFSTILGFVPNGTVFLASLALWVVTLFAAYIYRDKDSEDGLLYNHMTYLIGTIWIGTSFIVLATMVMGFWVYTQGDNTPLDDAIASLAGGEAPNEAWLMEVLTDYLRTNEKLLWTASISAIGPSILYFVYRVANGLSRAAKGYRIANPKSWL